MKTLGFFEELEKAVQYAQEHVVPLVVEKARQSGAVQIKSEVERKDKTAKAKGNKSVFLETKLTFMALGRPGMTSNERFDSSWLHGQVELRVYLQTCIIKESINLKGVPHVNCRWINKCKSKGY